MFYIVTVVNVPRFLQLKLAKCAQGQLRTEITCLAIMRLIFTPVAWPTSMECSAVLAALMSETIAITAGVYKPFGAQGVLKLEM